MSSNSQNLNEIHQGVISFLDAGTRNESQNQDDENDENLSTIQHNTTRGGDTIPTKKGSVEMLRSLRKIQKALICSLCTNVLIEPVTIQCGHTFCCNCIDTHVDNSWHCPSK